MDGSKLSSSVGRCYYHCFLKVLQEFLFCGIPLNMNSDLDFCFMVQNFQHVLRAEFGTELHCCCRRMWAEFLKVGEWGNSYWQLLWEPGYQVISSQTRREDPWGLGISLFLECLLQCLVHRKSSMCDLVSQKPGSLQQQLLPAPLSQSNFPNLKPPPTPGGKHVPSQWSRREPTAALPIVRHQSKAIRLSLYQLEKKISHIHA